MGYGNSTIRSTFPVIVVAPSTPKTTRYYDNAEIRTGERILGIDAKFDSRVIAEALKNERLTTPKAARVERVRESIPAIPAPKYPTETSVTLAVVMGEIPFLEIQTAYRLAKEYQVYLKKISKPKFFPKKAIQAATMGINFRPGYATK